MKNLVIGNTSQLSYYFPNDYIKVSSRNINYDVLTNQKWNRVFVCIGESRKFINNQESYDKINVDLTLDIIEKFSKVSQKIIIYSTCELWNQYDGQINLNMGFNFYNSFYIDSKHKISKIIINNQERYNNVIVLYPFNFNSVFRSEDFLFGKIFDSILNKNKIEIGDTYFYRDLIHPKYVVERSIRSETHEIIGSGRLTFVNDFIRDLYKYYGLDYEELVVENKINFKQYEKRKEYYLESQTCQYSYSQLLTDTINDINEKVLK